MIVKELIEELKKHPPDAMIKSTWEGVVRGVEIYMSYDGVLLVDADGGSYRDFYESSQSDALNE